MTTLQRILNTTRLPISAALAAADSHDHAAALAHWQDALLFAIQPLLTDIYHLQDEIHPLNQENQPMPDTTKTHFLDHIGTQIQNDLESGANPVTVRTNAYTHANRIAKMQPTTKAQARCQLACHSYIRGYFDSLTANNTKNPRSF